MKALLFSSLWPNSLTARLLRLIKIWSAVCTKTRKNTYAAFVIDFLNHAHSLLNRAHALLNCAHGELACAQNMLIVPTELSF